MCGQDQPLPKRQRWTARAKLEVVVEGLRQEESVAELCRRHGITQSMYYAWLFRTLDDDEAPERDTPNAWAC